MGMSDVQRLYELLEDGQPIYVRNRTGRRKGVPTKLIMLQIVSPAGTQKTIKIPPTKFPIPISTLVAPPKLLGDSQDFIDLLNKRELELVEPTDAMQELADPTVAAAVQKALADIHHRAPRGMPQAGGAPRVLAPGEMAPHKEAQHPLKQVSEEAAKRLAAMDRDPLTPLAISNDSSQVNTRIVAMMHDLQKDRNLAAGMLVDLQGMSEDDIGEAELSYILSRCSWNAPITHWAEERMAELMDEGYEDEEDEDYDLEDFETTYLDDPNAPDQRDIDAALEKAAAAAESKRVPSPKRKAGRKKSVPKKKAAPKKTARKKRRG